MLDRVESKRLADKILSKIPADEAEVIVTSTQIGASRFAGNAITQNVDESTRIIRLRVIKDGRQGVAIGNSDRAGSIDTLVARALRAAEYSQPDLKLLPMISEQPEYSETEAFNSDTFEATPRLRAERIVEQLALCEKHGLEGAGLFITGGGSVYFANTHEVSAYHRSSIASFSMSAFAENGKVEGWADTADHNVNSLSTRRVGNTAMDKAIKGRNPKPIEPGKYDVVLEKGALADLVHFLYWLGFNTQSHIEKRSGLAGKLDQQVFSEKLTIRSDPYDLRFEGQPFDWEGYPAHTITLVQDGDFINLPHDRRTAKAMSHENNGCASRQPSPDGPQCGNIVVKEGDATLDSMIESTENGLLVNQFHYTNVVDPMALSITGMTRAGLWRIEKGKVTTPVTNLRFSENLLKAFTNIEAIGNISEPTGAGIFNGSAILPAMKIKGFNFSSTTDF